jgi:hypothetical protein
MEASTEGVLGIIRESATGISEKFAEEVAALDKPALEKFAMAMELESIFKAEFPGVVLPLRFSDRESEINFYALIHCLDFGTVSFRRHHFAPFANSTNTLSFASALIIPQFPTSFSWACFSGNPHHSDASLAMPLLQSMIPSNRPKLRPSCHTQCLYDSA